MGTLQLAVTLFCGYIFVINSIRHKYNFKRTAGWDAYFYIAIYGLIFSCIGWFICSCLSAAGFFRWAERELVSIGTLRRLFPVLSDSELISLKELKMLIWSSCSILIAIICAIYQKWRLSDETRRIQVLSKVAGHNAIESLLLDASVSQFPVITTLKSRKVYVGIIICPQLESGYCEFLALIPLLSGYRDKENLKVNFSVNYQSLYLQQGISNGTNCSKLSLEDFITLIPKQEIDNISFFDLSTYQQFQAIKEDRL